MSNAIARLGWLLSLLVLALAPSRAEPPKLPVPAIDQSAVAQRGYFYVGGTYVGEPGKDIMQGQIYVEVLAPKDVRRPYPLVLIHGAAQTATNWMGTPDGRKGWANYFVEQGYIVYMIDQPMRARSAWHPADGATRMFSSQQEQFQFTAVATDGTWPGREKHTQWPGGGAPRQDRAGDRAHAFAIRSFRLADRGCAAAVGQGDHCRRARWPPVRGHHHQHWQGARLGAHRYPAALRPAGQGPE